MLESVASMQARLWKWRQGPRPIRVTTAPPFPLASRLTGRPYRVVQVDNIRVLVFQRSVPVWMVMWFRSLPAFVFMSVALIVDMEVLVLQRLVPVLQLVRVLSRPQSQSSGG